MKIFFGKLFSVSGSTSNLQRTWGHYETHFQNKSISKYRVERHICAFCFFKKNVTFLGITACCTNWCNYGKNLFLILDIGEEICVSVQFLALCPKFWRGKLPCVRKPLEKFGSETYAFWIIRKNLVIILYRQFLGPSNGSICKESLLLAV